MSVSPRAKSERNCAFSLLSHSKRLPGDTMGDTKRGLNRRQLPYPALPTARRRCELRKQVRKLSARACALASLLSHARRDGPVYAGRHSKSRLGQVVNAGGFLNQNAGGLLDGCSGSEGSGVIAFRHSSACASALLMSACDNPTFGGVSLCSIATIL